MKVSMRGMLLAAALCAVLPARAVEPIGAALDATLQAQQAAARSQAQIDSVAAETRTLAEDYRRLAQQADTLRVYDDQLERLVANQKAELDGYAAALATAQQTRDKLLPLLQTMTRTLEEFVKRDLPFLAAERRARVEAMKALLDQPEVAASEKFRRLMEAWQIEADYGHTLDAYTEPVEIGGRTRTVDILRVGRTALFCLSFDRRDAGYWDRQERVWKALPAGYNHRIARGLQIASRGAPPEILALPVTAPEGRP